MPILPPSHTRAEDRDLIRLYLNEAAALPRLDVGSERALSEEIRLAESGLRRVLSRCAGVAQWLITLGHRIECGEVQVREALLLPPGRNQEGAALRDCVLERFHDLQAALEAAPGEPRGQVRLRRCIRGFRLNAAWLSRACDAARSAGDPGNSRLVTAAERRLLQARNALAEANLLLVVHVSGRFRNPSVSKEDLIQEGNLGLLRAVERFDPSRGTRFSTYAVRLIWEAMIQAVEAQGKAVRLPSALARAAKAYHREVCRLQHVLDREARPSDIAKSLGWTRKDAEEAFGALNDAVSFLSDGEDGPTGPGLFHPDPEPSAFEVLERRAMRDRLQNLLPRLPKRDRKLLDLHFGLSGGEAETLRTAGDTLGVSGARAQQLKARALEQLRSGMGTSRAFPRTA